MIWHSIGVAVVVNAFVTTFRRHPMLAATVLLIIALIVAATQLGNKL